jgi:dihydrofolate synthase/folylpolyglutamate synthase
VLKSRRPGVLGRQREAGLAAIEAEAERVGAPLSVMGRDFDAWPERGGMAFSDSAGLMDLPAPGLAGPHQVDNAGLAIAAARALPDVRITDAAIAAGVAGASWPARMQRLTGGPFGAAARVRGADLWLDGGHNPHAARALAHTLGRMADGRPLVLIAGLLANKDAAGWFSAFAELQPRVLTVSSYAEAAADARELADVARGFGLTADAATGSTEPSSSAGGHGTPPRVVIAGSLYLAGEVLGRSEETWPA